MKNRKSFDVISNLVYNDAARANKVLMSGDVSETIYGNNSATAQLVGANRTLRVFNTDTNVQYIGLGDSTVAVPTVTTGIALAPSVVTYVNTGVLTHFRTSNNAVQVVLLKDEQE